VAELGLALLLDDDVGVGLEDRNHLLLGRHLLPAQYAALGLIDDAHGQADEVANLEVEGDRGEFVRPAPEIRTSAACRAELMVLMVTFRRSRYSGTRASAPLALRIPRRRRLARLVWSAKRTVGANSCAFPISRVSTRTQSHS
jgi:hypothetical protein